MVFSKVSTWSVFFVILLSSLEIFADETATNEIKTNGTGDGERWCFQCNSATHDGCLDLKTTDTKSIFFKRCPSENDTAVPDRKYYCRKITQTVTLDDKDEKRVIRKCGWIKHEPGKECYKIVNPAHREIVCLCDTNGCNAAPAQFGFSHHVSILSVTLVTSFALFRFY